jgi:hypothetical protein
MGRKGFYLGHHNIHWVTLRRQRICSMHPSFSQSHCACVFVCVCVRLGMCVCVCLGAPVCASVWEGDVRLYVTKVC